jgi:hypothetical protein
MKNTEVKNLLTCILTKYMFREILYIPGLGFIYFEVINCMYLSRNICHFNGIIQFKVINVKILPKLSWSITSFSPQTLAGILSHWWILIFFSILCRGVCNCRFNTFLLLLIRLLVISSSHRGILLRNIFINYGM